MIDKQSPTVKEMVKEDPLKGKLAELRTQYKAATSNAEITKGDKVAPWEDWLREKGYGLANGQLVRSQ